MKNKTNRVLTSLVSAVMAVSAVTPGALFSAVAEEGEKPVVAETDEPATEEDKKTDEKEEYKLPEKGISGDTSHGEKHPEYRLTEDGLMSFDGEGQLDKWEPYYCYHVKDIRDKAVVWSSNITLGDGAFSWAPYTTVDLMLTTIDTVPMDTFYNDINLKEVMLPDTVENIGEYAFYNCQALETLEWPRNIKRIENVAFENCGLKVLELPKTVEYVGDNAFRNCDNLTEVYINSEFKYSDEEKKDIGYIFTLCDNLEKVELSDDVETIWSSEFCQCSSLKDVKLSKNLKVIKDHAFQSTPLEKIDLPDGLEIIEESVFINTKLKEVIIPKSVTFIGNSAFSSPTLKKITILNPECDLNISSIYGSADTVIYGYKGSTAEKYAADNSKKFVALDAETTTTSSTKPAVTTTAKTTATTKAATTTTAKTTVTTKAATTTTAKTSATTKAATTTTAKTSATTKAATTTTAASDYVAGDANCDGKVDISDAVIIMQSISNPSKYSVIGTDPSHMTKAGQLNADVNNHGDGMTNKDALTIQKYALQLIDTLPES